MSGHDDIQRRNRRTALWLGVVALAVYLGYIILAGTRG